MCFLFFYSTFSLLSIFYSTFSLSSHRFNPCSLSLSSLDQIPSPSPIPHRSSRCHRLWFEDSIATDLKSPSPLPIWSSLIWSYIFLHTLAADGWLSLVIDWSIGLGFCWRFWVFFYLFIYWGFWIWNLLEDPVIVVVVCGGGCCCDGGCWFLGGDDCHWAVHLCICWVLSKYII